jgi:hypothetical protein
MALAREVSFNLFSSPGVREYCYGSLANLARDFCFMNDPAPNAVVSTF